ncbi:MAG: helix-turn-helix domain-containing protein [Paludibacter sp.]|nr:helix-turn-helix domain-containing protein [Paludibacter sp.]
MYTKQEIILQSYRLGKGQRQISRDLNINRKTVKRYIEEYEKLQQVDNSSHPSGYNPE